MTELKCKKCGKPADINFGDGWLCQKCGAKEAGHNIDMAFEKEASR